MAGVLAAPASALLIGSSGDVTILGSPPASVERGVLESNAEIFVFRERGDVEIPLGGVAVDITLPGTYDAPGDAFLSSATLADGLDVASYLVHFDMVGMGGSTTLSGSLTFQEVILGLIVLPGDPAEISTLALSDPVLGAPGTAYPTGAGADFRGLENLGGFPDPLAADVVVLSADLRTVSFTLTTFEAVDQLRIVTRTPEPATLALVALGLAALARRARRTPR